MDYSQIIIERAKSSDVKGLTHVSKKAFDDDSTIFMSRENGGPPGYSSEAMNSKMIKYHDYYKIRLTDFTTIGGIIVSQNGEKCYLQRMFINPIFQNQGIGKYVIEYIQNLYRDVSEWNLDTPKNNIRTNHFYVKCGFQLIKCEKELNFYSKKVQ
jgi:GNAT superfamily N-acetyltransferase